MKDDENRESRRRSVWLPATVLLLLLTLVGGTVYWLTLAPPPGDDSLARVETDPVGPQQAATKNPEPIKEPAEATAGSAPIAAEPAVPADPVKSSEIKPSGSSPAAQSNQSTEPPQETASKGENPPPDPAVAVTKEDVTAPPPPPTETKVGPAPVTTAPPAVNQSAIPAPPAKPELPQVAAPAPTVPAPPTGAPAKPERNTAIAPPVGPSISKLPRPAPSAPLPRAPDPALIESSPEGPLPVVGRDGREAWRVYARPFDQLDKRPRISVVLYGLGTSGAATRTAIQGLPGAITLAFSPYADGLGSWIPDARAAGHEILLMVPMEPRNYPDYDPGPQALLTSLTRTENTKRLEWILGRGVGYVGVTDFMGSRFTNSTQHMRALFQNLRKRGLMFLESRLSARAVSSEIAAASKVPYASSALYIDSQASRPAIDAQLAETERLAKKLGAVVVMGFLYPVTLERVAKWAATVEKRGFVLAPVSAVANRRN